ncbi:MAG: lysophospholipase [Pirellulales bacterium]|nr:lysophospholipase [Pirellulales bacterium]
MADAAVMPVRPERRWWRWVAALGLLAVAAYAAKLYHMWAYQESYWFLLTPASIGDWEPEGLPREDVWFESSDGTRLFGWYVPHPQPRGALLFLHGSGGNIALPYQRDALLELHRLGLSIFVFDYRGYGRSAGTPTTEEQFHRDARAALDWLCRREKLESRAVLLLGRSMGATLAMRLAGTAGARCLILENGPPSLTDVAAVNYRWAPMRWLQRYRFEGLPDLARYDGPLFQSQAERDEVVPMEMARSVFDTAHGRKELFVAPGLRHGDSQPVEYYVALDRFLDEVLGPQAVLSSEVGEEQAAPQPPQAPDRGGHEQAGHG